MQVSDGYACRQGLVAAGAIPGRLKRPRIAERSSLILGCALRREDAFETRLQELGYEHLLLALDFPGGDPPFLNPGESYRMSGFGMVPAAQFDGALYLAFSRKMSPLAWPSCR